MRDREKEKSMSYIKNADIQGNAWVAPGACVVGNVTLGDESSVWYNAVPVSYTHLTLPTIYSV